MAVDEQEVRRIAALARLTLSDEDVARYAGDLTRILAYVEKLGELDLSEVPPTSHASHGEAPLREDEVHEHMPREEALANAPAQRDGLVVVPKVIG